MNPIDKYIENEGRCYLTEAIIVLQRQVVLLQKQIQELRDE